MTLRNILFMVRHKRACRQLQRMVDRNRSSFEIQDFTRRREAALKSKRVPAAIT